jgi:hypothetical protein
LQNLKVGGFFCKKNDDQAGVDQNAPFDLDPI